MCKKNCVLQEGNEPIPDYLTNWQKIMCKTNEERTTFLEILEMSTCYGSAIMNFRRELLESGKRGFVDFAELKDAWENDKIEKCTELINELCLDCIDEESMECFRYIGKQNGLSIEDIYERHLEDKEDRFFCLISYPKKESASPKAL